MRIENPVIQTARQHYNPGLVSINQSAIRALEIPASQLQPMDCGINWGKSEADLIQGIAYLIGLNSINYMFWSLESVNTKKSVVRYTHHGLVGAMGMRSAYDTLWGKGTLPIHFRQQPITPEFVRKHFGQIPDAESRAALLSEVFAGSVLERLSEELYRRICSNGKVNLEDALLIQTTFPRAYADAFYKRSQLALMEIASLMSNAGIEVNTAELTICADYQLPRVLRSLRILNYSHQLAHQVDNLRLIEANSPEELAIRAATVLACDEWSRTKGYSTAAIDNYLWLNRNHPKEPFHLTFTEAY